jgi:phosphoribosyl-ATP pyrophosphohydrolase/phosphoribosyl-AMP cyclohydrolase
MTDILDTIRFDKQGGLVPAVIQDAETKDVLMLGFMNREALEKTLADGLVTFWQRSTQKLWTKGMTSGNVLKFVSLRINCNDDSLLIQATPVGPTCHTMHPTCYYREATADRSEWTQITEPQADPQTVYGRA